MGRMPRMTKIKPHWQILAALVLATLTAFLFRGLDGEDGSGASGFISGAVKTFEFLGKDIFMNLLKMIIVPLIVSSVVAGIASLHGMEGFGRMLGKTAGFYAFTGLFAILVGLSMVNLIKPGLTDGEPNETIEKAFKNQFEGASESDKEKVASFREALSRVCRYLAEKVVSDGERITKVVEVKVEGAMNDEAAERVARAIGNSLLVKTSWYGGDPNWGRLVDAAGYAKTGLEFDKIDR